MRLLPAFNPLISGHTSSLPTSPSRKGCLFWLVYVLSRDKIQQSDWLSMVMSFSDWLHGDGTWRKVWDYMCTLCVQFSSSSPLFPHLIVPSPPPEIRYHVTRPQNFSLAAFRPRVRGSVCWLVAEVLFSYWFPGVQLCVGPCHCNLFIFPACKFLVKYLLTWL